MLIEVGTKRRLGYQRLRLPDDMIVEVWDERTPGRRVEKTAARIMPGDLVAKYGRVQRVLSVQTGGMR